MNGEYKNLLHITPLPHNSHLSTASTFSVFMVAFVTQRLTVLMIVSVQDICVHTFLGGGGGACTALVFLSASLPEALSYLT